MLWYFFFSSHEKQCETVSILSQYFLFDVFLTLVFIADMALQDLRDKKQKIVSVTVRNNIVHLT